MARGTAMDRDSRNQELRAADPIHEPYFVGNEDGLLLDTQHIPPRDGFTQRWVRTMLNGAEDQGNIVKAFNKGFRPRLLDTVPQGKYVQHLDFNGQQVIGIHGMILMECPKEISDARTKRIHSMTNLQMAAVQSELQKTHDPNSGFNNLGFTSETKSNTSVGRQPIID